MPKYSSLNSKQRFVHFIIHNMDFSLHISVFPIGYMFVLVIEKSAFNIKVNITEEPAPFLFKS